MHSNQSVIKKPTKKLTRRQRRGHNATAAEAATTSFAIAFKLATAYNNTVPKGHKIQHGIVVSNLSLVLLQKEYIEQFYFEKRNGGGGPEDPDANADINRHLHKTPTKYLPLHFG